MQEQSKLVLWPADLSKDEDTESRSKKWPSC